MAPLIGPRLGTVIDNVDPRSGGRVRVQFAEVDGDAAPEAAWARVVTPIASPVAGRLSPPAVGDEVLVVFEQGDARAPYVLGRVWNQADRPPDEAGADEEPTIFRSQTGITLTVDEAPGEQRVSVETPAGQKVTIDGVSGEIEILDPFGNTIRLSASGIALQSSANIILNTAATLQLTAAAVRVDADTVICSGTLQCETLVSKSVVSASYSPGAGNIW